MKRFKFSALPEEVSSLIENLPNPPGAVYEAASCTFQRSRFPTFFPFQFMKQSTERELRTPAMQAGLPNWSLTLREIFSSRVFLWLPKNVIFILFASARPVAFTPRELALVDWQQFMTEAPSYQPYGAEKADR